MLRRTMPYVCCRCVLCVRLFYCIYFLLNLLNGCKPANYTYNLRITLENVCAIFALEF